MDTRRTPLLAGQAFEDGLTVSRVGLLLAAGFGLVIGLAAGVWQALRASRRRRLTRSSPPY